MHPLSFIGRAVALGFSLSTLSATAAQRWDQIPTPSPGEAVVRPASEVVGAVLEAGGITAFAAQYKKSGDQSALVLAHRALKINSIIPEESAKELQSLLEPSRTEPAHEIGTTYVLPFRKKGQDGVSNATLTIDWRNRMLISCGLPSLEEIPPLKPDKTTLARALALFRNYLIVHVGDVSNLRLTAGYYGDTAIILSCSEIEPSILPASDPTRYYLDAHLAREVISQFSPETIRSLVDGEFWPITKDKRLRAIKTYIELSDFGGRVIESARDIPGFGQRPIDPDVVRAIQPLFQFTSSNNDRPNSEIFVCYCYQQLGGRLTRFRFTFGEQNLENVTIITLGEGVGAATYRL